MSRQMIVITFDADDLAEGGPKLGQEMASYLKHELVEAYGDDGEYLMGYEGPFVTNVEATHSYLAPATVPVEYPEHEHDWQLTEEGYVRTWSTRIYEDGTIDAVYNGTDDWGDEGDGNEFLQCTVCWARREIEEPHLINWL